MRENLKVRSKSKRKVFIMLNPRQQKTKHGVETPVLSSAEEIQKSGPPPRINVLLGHEGIESGVFPNAWANSKQCKFLCIAAN